MLDTPDQSDTRECPFCAELIKRKAIKCRYCGSLLTEDAMARFAEELARLRTPSPQPDPTQSAQNQPLLNTPPQDALASISFDTAPQPTPDGTARLATVLFADLSGFTELSGSREPEEMREIMNALFSDLAGAVDRFGGKVDKYIGDCVMAVWGTEEASPEDPIRATNAALTMLHRMKGRAERLELPLALHVGISTGRVVFGTLGTGAGAGMTVLGDTVNLASRLCSKAPNSEVFVSDETWRRLADRFQGKAVSLELKGIGKAFAYSVVPGKGRARSNRRVVIDFQGRETEIGRIASALDAVREASHGRRAGVLVIGQGGVGKSRLCAYTLKHHGRGIRILFGQAVSSETPVFGALAVAWIRDFVLEASPSVEEFFKGKPHLDQYRGAVQRLLSTSDDSGPAALVGETNLDEVIARFFLAASVDEPLVLAGADIQWADPLSSDLILAILRLGGRQTTSQLLLVLDGRPGVAVDRLRGQTQLDAIDIGILSLEMMERILASIMDVPPPPAWVRTIRDRTSGVFIHFSQVLDVLAEREILQPTKSGRWHLARPDLDLPIPESLQDLIWLRIERLPTWSRELLLHAAVCGIRFPRHLLELALGRARGEIEPAIASLESDGFLHLAGELLAFEHGSIRETARRMLLKAERKRIAERVLDALGNRIADDAVRSLAPDLFRDADRETALRRFLATDAYRLIRAFRPEEAAALLDNIGRDPWPDDSDGDRARAMYLVAMSRLSESLRDIDAAFQYQSDAVEILRRRAPGTADLARAIGLLGRIATKREDWQTAQTAAAEALALCREIGDEMGLGVHTFLLGWIAEQREDWPTALKYFEDSLHVQRTARGLRVSNGSIGRAAIELGDIPKARRHGFEALASADRDGAIAWNPHAYVSILTTTARVSWREGDISTAFKHFKTGLDLARAADDNEAQFMVLLPLAKIAIESGLPEIARDLANRALDVTRRLGYPRWEKRVQRLLTAIENSFHALQPEAAEQLRLILLSLETAPPRRETIAPITTPLSPMEESSRTSSVDI